MATKVSSYLTKLGFRQLEHVADAANYNNETGGEYIVIRENTRIYLYDATSNAPIDSISILPTSDGGTSRWIAVGGGAMTQYKISYTFESYSNEIPLGMTVLSKANIFYVNIENTQILSTEFNLNDAKDTIVLSKPFEAGVRTEVVIFVGDYQPESRDYELLTNKPMVNGITLVGNRSLRELGIQPAGDYATNTRVNTVESTLENKKADKATTLAGYNIGDAYTKTEVDQLINEKEYLPDQTGNGGKFLTTNGTTASWETTVDYDNITNCITEIPQDIKLELNNGTLTLKAGSKVYVPNGFEADGITPKFDVITVENDIEVLSKNSTNFIYYIGGQANFDKNIDSGTTFPSNPQEAQKFYKIDENCIYRFYGTNWNKLFYSLPLGFCKKASNNTVTSIEQVFNGFGYIGSTMFVLPGVKGLIPNGRNADGSLKNIEYSNTIVRLRTFTWDISGLGQFFAVSTTGLSSSGTNIPFYQQEETPPAKNFTYWYKPSENIMYSTGSRATWHKTDLLVVGPVVGDNTGKITSFTPKTVFHAVDYSDFENKLNTKQDISNLSQTLDDSTTKYPSNAAVKAAIDAKDSLPDQTGNADKFLKTDGTTASWEVATTITFLEFS